MLQVRSRVFNLKGNKNRELRENVLCGLILPEKIATMTAEEMASDFTLTWSLSSSEEGELKGKTDPLLEDTGRDQTKTHGSKSERRSEDSVPPKGGEPHKNDLGKKPESDSEHEIDHNVLK